MPPLFKRCFIFLADGARPDVLNEELKKGNLPNIARYIVEKGTNHSSLTCFPSTTGAAYLPYLTGCFPGTCNLPGIRWFDKDHYAAKGWSLKSFRSYVGLETFLINKDISPQVKTIFDLLKNSKSAFNSITRGIAKGGDKTKLSRIWYMYYAHLTDHWALVDKACRAKTLKALDEEIEFAFVVFPAIDEYSHRSSPFHPRTLKAYQELDTHLGEIFKKLEAKGQLEETLLVLVSDHGLSDTTQHFDVGPWLEEEGIKTFFYSQILKRNFKAASMISGNAMAHLYFENKRNGWKGRTSFEDLSDSGLLLDRLRLRPEIGLVATEGMDKSIHIHTERGHGLFKKEGETIQYEWGQEEPLGIIKSATRGGKKVMTMDESLEETCDSRYPDVFMQLSQLFRSSRCGDVLLSANKGYDLRKKYESPEHRSSHGSLSPEHMKVPFLINYPLQLLKSRQDSQDQSKKVIPIRSVDIFPTVLKLLGKEIPSGIDGKSLV